MQTHFSKDVLEACADRQRAAAGLEQLRTSEVSPALRRLSREQARALAALLSGSQLALELLVAHPEWLGPLLAPGYLARARRVEGLRLEVQKELRGQDFDSALGRLRRFKQREMLRIAARDLARLDTMEQITREISAVADVCLQTVHTLCARRLSERLGHPWHLDAGNRWRETEFCVIGLGKLGGQELNYSSDVDLMFVYAEEGNVFRTPPRASEATGRGTGNHQFFARLAEAMIAEIARLTPDGALYRVDLRLRPEGKAGPLARSAPSYETYYSQWGQTWERMMLIKARTVAGGELVGTEFLEMTQSFRYPRMLNPRTVREVAAVKTRIENEVVKQGELKRNVKLGRGGIREIEFVVQTLQLLHAGRLPFLQEAGTLAVLQKLARYSLLSVADAQVLEAAYVFLREVEHRLQMEAGLQTHTIPTERRARQRLARLMSFPTLAGFEEAHRRHTAGVRRIYERLLPGTEAEAASLPPEGEWQTVLTTHGFRDPGRAVHLLRLFINGPDYAHVSARTVELARELWGRFMLLCPGAAPAPKAGRVLSDPDRVLTRLDSFIEAYGARATLYEMWTQNPKLFELLLLLFDRSEFLAERAIQEPDLVDELESNGRLNRARSAEETLADLRLGAGDADQRLWLRRYHQAEFMRIGLRDILGLSDFEQIWGELSSLADACLQYALETVMREGRFKSAPLCVIGLGKLGGREINYGSDLDVLFVADEGAARLPRLQRLAAALMELLSARTETGTVFRLDARLRPDGEKGLLVNTLGACEEYYRRRAQLWEIQALTRVRLVAGNMELGARFARLAGALTNFSAPPAVAAYTPEWLGEIDTMRRRIEKERTPPGKDHLAIKTGVGGLMDAEFLAQAHCLANGWQEANTMKVLRRAGEPPELLESYAQLERVEGILRRWSFEGEVLLPDDEPALRRVAVRCGFGDAADFMRAMNTTRGVVRAAYLRRFRNVVN